MPKIGIATNKKLLELFNMMKNSSLLLTPSFQRKLVWNDTHKEDFIETILLGLPFPEIYLADGGINLDTQTSETLVVDGQQRLSTIYQYVTSSPEFNIKRMQKFADLTPEQNTFCVSAGLAYFVIDFASNPPLYLHTVRLVGTHRHQLI